VVEIAATHRFHKDTMHHGRKLTIAQYVIKTSRCDVELVGDTDL